MTDTNSPANASRASPAFTTGGGGFEFESHVGTWVVAAMVAGRSPLPALGVPSRVGFQQKAPPAPLDDIVVGGAGDTAPPRWFASIKSYDMLRGEALAEFSGLAWAQLLGDEFDRDSDYVGLITGQAGEDDWRSILQLVKTARHDTPERMSAAIAAPGAYNATDRRLWTALACPEALAQAAGLDVATSPAVLLSYLVPLRLDFRAPDSRAEAEAREWCAEALATGHADAADDLYNAIYQLVSETIPVGGSVDWRSIARAFGRRFALALRPDAGPDWALLHRHTQERINAVSDTLGGGLRLPRAEARAELARVANASVVYLSGPSGCGKTALAKAWLAESAGSQLWLSARDLACGLLRFGQRLALRLALADIVGLGEAPVRIVIDGLDRLYETEAHAAVAALARVATNSDGACQLLVTSQAFSLDRLLVAVARAGGPTHEIAVVGDLDDADVAMALRDSPHLQRLAFQGELRGVLRRPKILQVVFQALPQATDEVLAHVSDEASVADLWWDQLAVGPMERTARSEFLRGLAQWTADQLTDALPSGQLATAQLSAYAGVADTLRAEEILDIDDDAFAFAHDLFADWTRYRAFGEWDDAVEAIGAREDRPTWHRAIRLYALRTLRRDGTGRWWEQHDALRTGGRPIAADLYLDAPLFASDAATQIETLWPVLIADHGALLARLLNRFAHIATVPDPRSALLTAGADAELETYVAATWRVPIWVLWPPILTALARHVDEAVAAAPLQVAGVADRWLRLTPAGYVGRDVAARLGYAVGVFLDSAHDRGVYFDEDQKVKLWQAFIAAGAELPAEVTSAVVETFAAGSDAQRNRR